MKSIFTGITRMISQQTSSPPPASIAGSPEAGNQATSQASEEYHLDPQTAMVEFQGIVTSPIKERLTSPEPPIIIEIDESSSVGHGKSTQKQNPNPDQGGDRVSKKARSRRTQTSQMVDLSDSQGSAPGGKVQSPSVASRLRKRKDTATIIPQEPKRSRLEKGKGISSAGEFDCKRFISLNAQKRFEVLKNSKFINEKEVAFGDEDGIKDLIEAAGMVGTVQDLQVFDPVVLREFWANLPSVKVDTSSVDVLVRDWVYEFSAAKVNELFGLPHVDERTHRKEWAGVLEEDLAEYMTDGKVKNWNGIQYAQFTEERKMMYKICCSNWSPTTNDAYPQADRVKLIYLMANNVPFNFGKLVYEHVLQLALNPQSKFYLPFPSLIYKLLMAQHPIESDKKQQFAVKKKVTVAKSTATPSTLGVEIKTASDRKGVMLAIKILQQALAAGGDVSESDSGNDAGGD